MCENLNGRSMRSCESGWCQLLDAGCILPSSILTLSHNIMFSYYIYDVLLLKYIRHLVYMLSRPWPSLQWQQWRPAEGSSLGPTPRLEGQAYLMDRDGPVEKCFTLSLMWLGAWINMFWSSRSTACCASCLDDCGTISWFGAYRKLFWESYWNVVFIALYRGTVK